MFQGFFDEAGIAKTESVCVVAGFVGSEHHCKRVSANWREAVAPIGVLHCREFFTRKPQGQLKGIYGHLNVDKAEACVMNLIDLLHASELTPIGMAIDSKAFFSLSEDERRWMTAAVPYDKTWPMQGSPNNPWFACFNYSVTEANGFARDDHKVQLTFDRQDTYEGNASKIYEELRLKGGKWGGRLAATLSFSTRLDCQLLQAADLLAYIIPHLLITGSISRIPNKVVRYALDKLAIQKDYVRAMGVEAIDYHLRLCPFRQTFWNGLTDPDLLEQLRAQGLHVLAVKTDHSKYVTHHIARNRVRVIYELDRPQAVTDLGERNLTVGRDVSTRNNLDSGE